MELAPKFVVTIGGVTFENAALHNKPIKLEIEHRDHEASRLILTIHDSATDRAGPFPLFNSTPDPHTTPGIPVKCIAGWDDGTITTVFQGELVGKKNSYPAASKTTFVALHDSHNLRKFAKQDTLPNSAVQNMLQTKAAEYNCQIQIDPSAAGDPALTTAMEVIYQIGQSNWQLMLHYLVTYGFISCCGDPNVSGNTIVIKKDKTNDPKYPFQFGGTEYISHDIRSEQKRPSRAQQRRGLTHEPPPSGTQSGTSGTAPAGEQNSQPVSRASGKTVDGRKGFFARASTNNLARQLERQGREIQITLRFQPQMHNEEQIVLSGFGAQIDGTWETAEVVHSLVGKSETRLVCWQA
ncbi:MAG TPA: hypothetical protein VI756_09115 [Blastocatellia bacterium]